MSTIYLVTMPIAPDASPTITTRVVATSPASAATEALQDVRAAFPRICPGMPTRIEVWA